MQNISIGSAILIELPRNIVEETPVPAKGIIIKRIVGASSVLIEEVCLINKTVCFFDFSLEYIADSLTDWVFALNAFNKLVPLLPYSNSLLLEPTRDNILMLIEKCVKEMRIAKNN